MIRRNSIRLFFLSTLLTCSGSVVLYAELPVYVREDVGLCLHVRQIPMWVNELKNSEIRTRLEAAPFFQRWKEGYDYRGLESVVRTLELKLGHPPAEVLHYALGREALLAVYPDAGERPAGVFMTSPSDRNMAQKLIDFWNGSEEASVTRVDDKYIHRTSNRGVHLYYLLSDDLFALSDNEDLISDLAELGATGFKNSLAQSSRWKRAIGSLEGANWAIAYFQPDRWKHHLNVEHRDAFEEAFFRQIGMSESLAAGVDGRDGLHVRMNLLYPAGGEPNSLRQFRERTSGGPTNWSGLTARTILIAAGRSDPGYLAEVIKQQAPKSRELLAGYEVLRGLLLGRDPLDEVLPYVGRHWQYSIVAQPDRVSFPWDLQLQLDLEDPSNSDSTKRDGGASARPGLHTSLQNLVRTLVRIGGLFLSEPLATRSQLFSETLPNGATIEGFETVLGLSPTIGIGAGKLIVSNSRDSVVGELMNTGEPTESSQFSERLAGLSRDCCLGVYLNLKALRLSLISHADALFRLQAMDEAQIPAAKRRIEQQIQVLSLFDSAYAFGVLSEDLISLHFGIESLPQGVRATSPNE